MCGLSSSWSSEGWVKITAQIRCSIIKCHVHHPIRLRMGAMKTDFLSHWRSSRGGECTSSNVRETAPAYIHNCQLFMYVKPYLLLRLTCSRWTLNSLLQGGVNAPARFGPPRLPAPTPHGPHTTPPTAPSTTPSTRPHGTTHHTLHRAQRSPQG